MHKTCIRLAAIFALSLAGRSALAQDEYPPPTYYVPPPPPQPYYNPPVYYEPPPPWIRPPRFVRGFIGVSGFGTIRAHQDGGVEYLHHGGGVGLFGGLDLGRFFGIEIGYDASFHNPVTTCTAAYAWCDANYLLLETLHLDAKLHLPTGTRVMPYLQGGLVASWIGRTDSLTDATGGGFEAGGGIDFWLSRHGTFGIQALYRGLAMSDYATYTGTGTYLSLVTVGGNFTAHF
jgi:hypothetical protein